ncbi:MAG: S8 family serine peptidase [Candidatus Krumholzibacteria bacterium]|nr:S8 family serine peptidase [Candidatus Krumholzibacteria bacterium]
MKKILFPVLIALLLGAAAAGAQPYENSSVIGQVPDRVVITVMPGVKMALNKSAGTPQVGVAALDALAQRFSVHNMEAMYAGMTKNLDKASQSHFDRVWAVDFPAHLDIKDVKAAYESLPEVEEVRLVDICKMYDAYLPNDPDLSSEWFLRNMTMGGGDVRAVGAWSESLGDSNVVICILDSGLDWHHPDLGGTHPDKVNGAVWTNWTEYYGSAGVDDDGNGKIDDIRGWDFVNLAASGGWPDEDVTTADNDPMDYGSHGTQCGGMAAAITNNGVGIAGVAPGCKIMGVRAGYMPNGLNQGVVRMDFVSAGMVYAANNGADVINCSWGSTSFLSFAVSSVQSAGVLLVTAAGNDDTDSDPGEGVPSYLSTYPNVISVAATGPSDAKAGFSNYGSWVEISAPGTSIYTTTYDSSTDSHVYSSVQGTSFSSPITCGAAALIMSANPGMTANQVASALYASADNIDAVNPAYVGQLGAGRVNLLKALGDNVHRFPQEFPTLYDALNSSATGDTIAIPGSEMLTGPVTIPGKGLKVFGGYSADFMTRDAVANRSQISGPANNSALKFSGDVDNTTEVDGFLVTGGGGATFGGIPYSGEYGGGIMMNGTSPTLRNIEVTGNTVGDDSQLGAGGGVALNNSSAVLENVHIHDNTAVYGAGLFAFESTPTLIDCVIENNDSIFTNLTYSPVGGGIHALDSDLTLVDCTISGHLEQINGGGIYLAGTNAVSSLDMTGGAISGNSAKDNGGGLYITGGTLTVRRVLIDGNTKTATSSFMHGGGIYATAAVVLLDSLTCTNNQGMVGGAMNLVGNTSATVSNSVLTNNISQFWGGGLAYESNAAGTISGNTIAGNSATTGGAGIYLAGSAPVISNNIAAFNTGGPTYANGMALLSAPASLSCNDVFGNDGADYSGQPDPTGSNGNISVDPVFCNAGTGSYGIATNSPCAVANSGSCGLIGALASGCGESAVPDENAGVPMAFRVDQNFPNPFNPKTTIQFALPSAGRTRVNIFDVAGRHVRTLLDDDLAANTHQVSWTGDDDSGRTVSAGVYFYMVTSGESRSVGRMALIK